MAAITSTTPPSGRSRARLLWAENSQPTPPTSSAPARTRRSADHLPRAEESAAVSSGSIRCRSVACSSCGAFRQISTSPATLNTCGHAQPTNQPPLSALAASSTRMISDARPTASRMPRPSVLAVLAMLACSPAVGISSQPATYTGTNHPPDTKVISTNTIRTVVTLKPLHAATPAATPPPSRSAGSRRSGPPLPPRRLSQNGPRCRNGSRCHWSRCQRSGCSTVPSSPSRAGTAIRDIPDATLMSPGRGQGDIGDPPDVLTWPAEPR